MYLQHCSLIVHRSSWRESRSGHLTHGICRRHNYSDARKTCSLCFSFVGNTDLILALNFLSFVAQVDVRFRSPNWLENDEPVLVDKRLCVLQARATQYDHLDDRLNRYYIAYDATNKRRVIFEEQNVIVPGKQ